MSDSFNHSRLILSFVMLMIMAGCTEADNPKSEHVLRIAAAIQSNTAQGRTLLRFKELVEERSGGTIKIVLFFDGVLGNDTENVLKTQLGLIQGCNISTSNAAIVIPRFRAFELPFMFDNSQDTYRIFYDSEERFGGPVSEILQEAAEQHRVRIAWITPFFFRSIATLDQPVLSPRDLEGLKIRISASPIDRDIIASLGANPVSVGASEIYLALQQGAIDGEGLPLSVIHSFKHSEVVSHVSDVNYLGFGGVLLFNSKALKRMPVKLQSMVMQSASEVIHDARFDFAEEERESAAMLEQAGVELHWLSDTQKEAFRRAASGVIDRNRDEIGSDWIDLIKARTGDD